MIYKINGLKIKGLNDTEEEEMKNVITITHVKLLPQPKCIMLAILKIIFGFPQYCLQDYLKLKLKTRK